MAVPAILGLAALGGLVTKVIEKVVDFFLSQIGKKIAVLTFVFAGLYAAVTVLFSLMGLYVEPLIQGLPSEVTSLIGIALPSNTVSCIGAIVSVEAACITYGLTVKTLEYQSKVA